MITTRIFGQCFQKRHLQSKVRRCGKMSLEQIRTCPKTRIKFIKEAMHRRKATYNELFDLGIICKGYVIIESEETEDETAEHMRSWIDCYLFKEDTICS